jgi:lipoic acid synthetase
VLRAASEISPATATKSALLLGMGETREEVLAAMRDLRVSGVDRLALGQYLKPGRGLHEVARFLRPEEFDGLAAEARSMGFSWVASGPLVRSSFHAEL